MNVKVLSEITHLGDLTPDPANAREHNPRNVGMIEQALGEVGAARSIVIDEEGRVLAGNATIEAAARAGIENVHVVEADGETIVAVRRTGLTEEQKKRLALYDNRTAELAGWDFEQLQIDFDNKLLDGMFSDNELDDFGFEIDEPPEDAGAQIDIADELREKWGVETGQLWKLGEHRLVCGDCTDVAVVARTMLSGERIEMVFTDPPYGVAVGDKNKWLNSIARSNRIEENIENDTLDESALSTMLCAAFDNMIEICLPGAAWYVTAPAGPPHLLFGRVLKERGIWRQTIQWVKNNATFSPMGVDYHWQAEPIFYGWTQGAAHRYYGGRKQTTVWEIDRPLKSPEHPTMKPVELVERAIGNSSLTDDIVFDPFLGSGTTMIACERLGRKCRAVEISPAYCAVSIQRWYDMTGAEPELME